MVWCCVTEHKETLWECVREAQERREAPQPEKSGNAFQEGALFELVYCEELVLLIVS